MLVSQSSTRWRIGLVLLVGLLAALGGGAYELATYNAPFSVPSGVDPRPPAPGNPARIASGGNQARTAPSSGVVRVLPSFDVVRVSPDGGAVLAGRAAPGDAVTVTEGGRTIGETRADATGSWVLAPALKLPSGAGELSLTARALDGRIAAAEAPVLVIVPERPIGTPSLAGPGGTPSLAGPGGTPTLAGPGGTPSPGAPPLPAVAILAPPAAPSRVLQPPSAQPGGRALSMATLDYDENGAIRFSGSAPAGSPVRIYVDNKQVGDAVSDADGRWSLSPSAAVATGLHSLRVDQLTPHGAVASRVETPFQREARAGVEVAPGQVVVQPGQNLWRLARRVYGNGLRYTVIFLANKDQIRNVNIIYPGQVFAVPAHAALSPR